MHNSLKRSITNIGGLCSNFVDCEFFSWIKLSWDSFSMWDKPGWLNWFWQFLCESYLPLIRKNSSTHTRGPTVYVKQGLLFARELFLVNSADSYLWFWLALLHSLSYFFFLNWSPSLSLCMVLECISSNIDEVILLIDASADVFVFGDFTNHRKDWLTYSGGTEWSSEIDYNFSISKNLTQMVNFPTQIPDCDSHNPGLLDFLLSSDACICSTMAYPPLGN